MTDKRSRKADFVLYLKKFALLLIGVAITHCGVALSMVPDVGIGAYDAFGLTVAYATGIDVSIIYIAMSGVFILGQILMERKKFRLIELFQLVFMFGSGFFVSVFSKYVFDGIVIESYALRLFTLAMAIVIKAIGLIIIIESYFIRVPMEGFCVCISNVTRFSIGRIRMAFDVLFVVGIAIITPIAGVPWSMREGTAISFLIHGPMLDILQKPTRKLFSKVGIQPPPTLMNDPAEFVRTEHKTAS